MIYLNWDTSLFIDLRCASVYTVIHTLQWSMTRDGYQPSE